MKYTRPKGTFDITPESQKSGEGWRESAKWQHLEQVMRTLARDYGYQEIRTPIFEKSELFVRGVGETSDIVSKEMYTFLDKGERTMSLRPEGTAPVMRAFAEGQLQQLGKHHKLFYIAPFFRYDRPQAGRYRQFHQFGIEAVGDGSPEQDFEAIELLCELYRRLGLKNLRVLVNSLGDANCRAKYKEALLAYLKPHFSALSEESQTRFTKNPLRILDTKDPKERALLESAPSILECLSSESNAHFEALCTLLKEQNIPFVIDSKLVRGLDYYNGTVFEITSDVLGAQNTIGAGGRYDGLLPAIGGPDLPCIGLSTGIERILHTMEGQGILFPEKEGPFATLIPMGKEGQKVAFNLLYALRHASIPTEMAKTEKLPKALQAAEKNRSSCVVIIGEEELANQKAQVKALKTREGKEVPLDNLVDHLKSEMPHGF